MGIIFAIGFGGLVWYGIPQGFLLGDYLAAIFNGLNFESIGDFILTTGAVFSQGGVWFVLDAIESGLPGDVIYLILWSFAGVSGWRLEAHRRVFIGRCVSNCCRAIFAWKSLGLNCPPGVRLEGRHLFSWWDL
jgi:hypothetical protein